MARPARTVPAVKRYGTKSVFLVMPAALLGEAEPEAAGLEVAAVEGLVTPVVGAAVISSVINVMQDGFPNRDEKEGARFTHW